MIVCKGWTRYICAPVLCTTFFNWTQRRITQNNCANEFLQMCCYTTWRCKIWRLCRERDVLGIKWRTWTMWGKAARTNLQRETEPIASDSDGLSPWSIFCTTTRSNVSKTNECNGHLQICLTELSEQLVTECSASSNVRSSEEWVRGEGGLSTLVSPAACC